MRLGRWIGFYPPPRHERWIGIAVLDWVTEIGLWRIALYIDAKGRYGT